MLQDYRNYIINLRNGLIQCGVDVSISPLASYRELFYEADKLSQILWFYSIMEVSGSPLALDGFFIDLGKYYREEMRQRYYAEFQDYLDSYKHISKLAYLAGEEPKDTLGFPQEEEFDADEEFDIFGTNESEVSGTFIENISADENDDVEFEEVHGIFLEDVDFYYNVDKVLGTGYIPSEISVQLTYQDETLEVHGTFIDEISTESIHDSYIDDTSFDDSSETEVHGVVLDDIPTEEYGYSNDDDDGYDDINYSDDEDGAYYEEESDDDYCDINYSDDEDDGIEYSDDDDDGGYCDIHYSDDEEEYDDINYSEEDDDGYCDINYSDDEDEYYPEEEDDDYCDINYSDDEGEEYYEGDDDYCDINYSDDEEDEEYEEPTRVKSQTSRPNANVVQAPIKQGDMSDILQNRVNSLLTKGKRFIMTKPDRFRDVDKK